MDGALEIEAGEAEPPPTSAEGRRRRVRITLLSIGTVLAW
jgi:hypothetical protein